MRPISYGLLLRVGVQCGALPMFHRQLLRLNYRRASRMSRHAAETVGTPQINQGGMKASALTDPKQGH